MKITAENIKWGGCISTITRKLNQKFDTDTTTVDIEKSIITIDIADSKRTRLPKVLLSLCYPEIATVEGVNAFKAKAKSFVSCAIGKTTKWPQSK